MAFSNPIHTVIAKIILKNDPELIKITSELVQDNNPDCWSNTLENIAREALNEINNNSPINNYKTDYSTITIMVQVVCLKLIAQQYANAKLMLNFKS